MFLLVEDLLRISPVWDLEEDECVCVTVDSNSSEMDGGLLIGCWLTTGFF